MAIKAKQPILVYLRDTHQNEFSKNMFNVHREVGQGIGRPKEEYIGQRDLIDFVLHESYQQLITM